MNKEKLSIGNIITGPYTYWNPNIWVIDSLYKETVYARQFGNPAATVHLMYKDIAGIPLTVENVEDYLGIKMVNDSYPGSREQDWYDEKTHRIRICTDPIMSNRQNEGNVQAYYVHVDNESMDTIGTGDIAYINELQNFLNSIGFKS